MRGREREQSADGAVGGQGQEEREPDRVREQRHGGWEKEGEEDKGWRGERQE